ncbi:MAG: hypothetical protein LBK46_05175 [Oscillospiraceae bacterium]|nr:hypothetical protein [Oscillospiraceae bacterium]
MNKSLETVLRARELLLDVTPLKGDCGKICGRACCEVSDPDAGMILFPGEETLYTGYKLVKMYGISGGEWPWWRCDGTCERRDRPLACRVAPLTPTIRNGAVSVEMDRGCAFCCPLVEFGVSALSEDFVESVRVAAFILAEDPACRAFVENQTKHQDMMRAILLSSIISPERPAPDERTPFEPDHPDNVPAEEQRDIQQ